MHLTKTSDYSLRLLIYLAVHEDRPVTIGEVSRAYKISPNMLVKAAQRLMTDGTLASVRGRLGGLRLARAPKDINIGTVVRNTEPHFHLVECFDIQTNSCPMEQACGLKSTLKQAQRAFLGVLDQRTLADFLPRAPEMMRLLRVSAEGRLEG